MSGRGTQTRRTKDPFHTGRKGFLPRAHAEAPPEPAEAAAPVPTAAPAARPAPRRETGLDTLKGLLVVLMVYCHVLQFFCDTRLFPEATVWMDAINALVFPCFVFVFGRTAWLAFLSKPLQRAWPRMLRQTAMLYGAFCLSGIGYRVLAENRPLRARTVSRVLLLLDIPGWSEFLIAFALLSLLMLAGFALWRKVVVRPPLLALLCAAPVVAAACIPYEKIGSVWAALFIGGTQYAYFPALLYLPYALLGMAAQLQGMRRRPVWLLGAALVSLPACIAVATDGLPSRFPPSPFWLMLPALCICALSLMADAWTAPNLAPPSRLPAPARAVLALPGRALRHMGRHSLYYLLASNLTLFTLSGKGIVPEVSLRSALPWRASIASPTGGAIWTAVLLGCIGITLFIAGARKGE